jgi:hypothetical protein
MRGTVKSLCKSLPSLGTVILLNVLIVYVFSIFGMQVLSGRVSYCGNPEVPTNTTKIDCEGKYGSKWVLPPANYNNIFSSMLTFFEIQTVEDW